MPRRFPRHRLSRVRRRNMAPTKEMPRVRITPDKAEEKMLEIMDIISQRLMSLENYSMIAGKREITRYVRDLRLQIEEIRGELEDDFYI